MYGYLASSTYSKRSLTWLKSVNWGLGIVVHRFRLLFEFDQLAEGYFSICYYYVLYNHEQGTGNCPGVLFLMAVMYFTLLAMTSC